MLKDQECLSKVVGLIEKIMAEDHAYEGESRAYRREKIMIPCVVSNDYVSIDGFTRNLSASGACVVTKEPMAVGTVAHMQLSGSDGAIDSLQAECRWCKAFGAAYCVSGWEFIGLTNPTSNQPDAAN